MYLKVHLLHIRSYLPHTVGICPPDPISYILMLFEEFDTEPFSHLKYIDII